MLATGDTRGPDFICIGGQKAGTRWLFDQLDDHPQFWMPPIKELHYFDLSDRFMKAATPIYERAKIGLPEANRKRKRANQRLITEEDVNWLEARFWLHGKPINLDEYARLFNPRGSRLSGDICPPYAIIPDERARSVRDHFPNTTIIYLARDPIERLWSQYCMNVRRFDRPNPTDLAQVRSFVEKGTGLRHSKITDVLARWRTGPEDDRFRLYFFDDLKRDAQGLRRRIVNELGADDVPPSTELPADFNRKQKQAKVVMSDEVRAYLIPLFADEIRTLADEFGGPAVDWKNKHGL